MVLKLDENNYQEIELKITPRPTAGSPFIMQLTTKGFSNLTLRLKYVLSRKDGHIFEGSVTGRSYFLGKVDVGVGVMFYNGLNSQYGLGIMFRNGSKSYKLKAEAEVENR